jgi:two-component system alkaline phosphatase synthesis response regulator PhoP
VNSKKSSEEIIPKVRILVVDDNPAINELIQVTLREESQEWEILSAQDGEEAIGIVHEKPPNLIILDMTMPRMNGLEVCRRVTSQFTIPIIMVSGECDADTKSKCLNAGAENFIYKPFRALELISCVNELLCGKNSN